MGVGVNGCLSLCFIPATDQWPVQGIPCLVSYDNWDRLYSLWFWIERVQENEGIIISFNFFVRPMRQIILSVP